MPSSDKRLDDGAADKAAAADHDDPRGRFRLRVSVLEHTQRSSILHRRAAERVKLQSGGARRVRVEDRVGIEHDATAHCRGDGQRRNRTVLRPWRQDHQGVGVLEREQRVGSGDGLGVLCRRGLHHRIVQNELGLAATPRWSRATASS